MRPIIEFCTNNMHFGTDEVFEELEENLEYDVIEYGCLSNCGQCSVTPFALVNGEVVTGTTAKELHDAILSKIAEADAWNDLDL